MVIIIVANGLKDKNKEEDYKYIIKRIINIKANGNLTYLMDKVKLCLRMDRIIQVNLNKIINMEKVNIMMLIIKLCINICMKMVS